MARSPDELMFASLSLLATESCERFLENLGPLFFEDRMGPVEARADKKTIDDVANIFSICPKVPGVLIALRL